MPIITLSVPETLENPVRLDTYVASVPDGIPRSRLKSGVQTILLNGKKSKLSKTVKVGDIIEITWEDPVPDNLVPQDIPLQILFENENVTVINKKQGMVTHPAAGNWCNTLVNALLFHWGKSLLVFDQKDVLVSGTSIRPGIVHRLDKDTSGIMITGRNREAETWLQKQFQTRRVRKEYIVIVKGRPKEPHGTIKTGLVRDLRNRKKFTWSDVDKGKFAHTIYSCICVFGPYSLMRIKIKTGRTHQIRVHMKYLGCPVLGDPVYGKKDDVFDTATLMLHSRRLGIRLPNDDAFTLFEAPVPLRFKKVLRKLHSMYKKQSWSYEL